MSSSRLYPNVTAPCYKCDRNKSGAVTVNNGKQIYVECRQYNQFGIEMETRRSVMLSELSRKRLIRIERIGVDTAEFSANNTLRFNASSRGAGGLSKYECGRDLQVAEWIPFKKLGFTEMIYVHHDACKKNFIGTELQELMFPQDSYSEALTPRGAYSDLAIEAAGMEITRTANFSDIVGVFGSAQRERAAYDGILAQAFWAYNDFAYFQANKYSVDTSVFIDGTYLVLKFGGLQQSFKLDSADPNPENHVYESVSEALQAVVNWLNTEITTAGGNRIVDATFAGVELFVTMRFTEHLLDLQMLVSDQAEVDWVKCPVNAGVTVEAVQNTMPIDERPHLINYRKYNSLNIGTELVNDVFELIARLQDEPLSERQQWALYIDPKLMTMYKQYLATAGAEKPKTMLTDVLPFVETLEALNNTGLFFITAIEADGQSDRFRNILHLIDVTNNTILIQPDYSCQKIEFTYETLHGVLVKDFRLFGANLLCSPFINQLKTPHENTLPVLPCYDRRVRENMRKPSGTQACSLSASFDVSFFENSALYALFNPITLQTEIFVLQEGEQRPADALPVIEFKVTDKTTGIAPSDLPGVQYSYVLTTSGGAQLSINGIANPTFMVVGLSESASFNIIQTVSAGNCTDTYNYADNLGELQVSSSCSDVPVELQATFRAINLFTVDGTWNEDVSVTVNGNPALIDLTGNLDNNAAGAAQIINQWFADNGYNAANNFATATPNGLSVYSDNVVFVALDPSGNNDAFSRRITLAIADLTAYSPLDGAESYEVRVWCYGDVRPNTPSYNYLPGFNGEPAVVLDDCETFNVEVILKNFLGCTFTRFISVARAVVYSNTVFTEIMHNV